MQSKVVLRLIGAFALWWLLYTSAEAGPSAFLAVIVVLGSLAGLAIWAGKSRSSPVKSPISVSLHANSKRRGRSVQETRQPQFTAVQSVNSALSNIPEALRGRSGSVFYSGKEAFVGNKAFYLLGLNPGGDPVSQSHETIARDLADFDALTQPWSAYADESWRGALPGKGGMQPRVLHLLKGLGVEPRQTPASNVVFVRSRDEASLNAEKARLLQLCWPVHDAVIAELGISTVICFGSTAGRWVREQLGADDLIDQFREANARGWTSQAHICRRAGRAVITLTHPGRADWRNSAADPTAMVRRVLERPH